MWRIQINIDIFYMRRGDQGNYWQIFYQTNALEYNTNIYSIKLVDKIQNECLKLFTYVNKIEIELEH